MTDLLIFLCAILIAGLIVLVVALMATIDTLKGEMRRMENMIFHVWKKTINNH